MKSAYLFDIAHASSDAVLFVYLGDIESDVTLSPDDRDEIKTAITKRFGQLNAGRASQSPDRRFENGRWSGSALKPEPLKPSRLAADALNPS